MTPLYTMRSLAFCCLLLAPLAAARELQASGCTQVPEECTKVDCNGVLKQECDEASGRVTCVCQSAGLASCFPGAARVALPGGATKPMSELSLGDSVLAVGPDGRLQYAAVVMFSSRRPSQRAPFMRIHTDAGLNITATPGHYMFGWKAEQAQAAFAALPSPAAWPYVLPTQLEVGDLVPVVAAVAARAAAGGGSPALARVTAVERLSGEGVFMPHTLTGTIVVDGVVASELTSIVPPRLAGPAFQRHLATALRTACAVLPASAVEAVVRVVSSWAHGTPDASLSYAALTMAAS
ncbi:hypothetical protein D9Q98_010717 [Chlorella vulgaris]|uniref:Hint domain-containing protein n=1 Tax=Chlorella vulgaris TaxID=3077 RepID=A0A9D4YS55_CHLVU|nr:hypothetical protein D9Q98_010717 [Chlorella vulgaris]